MRMKDLVSWGKAERSLDKGCVIQTTTVQKEIGRREIRRFHHSGSDPGTKRGNQPGKRGDFQ